MRLESREGIDFNLKHSTVPQAWSQSSRASRSFRESELDGAIEQCLGLCSFLALLSLEQPCLFVRVLARGPPWPRRLHPPFVFVVVCSVFSKYRCLA